MITKTVPLRDLTTIHQCGTVVLNLIETPEEIDPAVPLIGNGSNVLIKKARKVQKLSNKFDYIDMSDELLRIGGATPLKKLVSYCVGNGFSCVEFLSGVPASVGGAVYMNAGAFGGEIGGFVYSVKVYDYKRGVIDELSDISFGYRNSSVNGVILEVCLKFRLDRPEILKDKVLKYFRKRKDSAHLTNTFGSVFKNPDGENAGRLIEACGLKGKSKGSAAISNKHANYIVGSGSVNVDDVLFLIDLAKSEVFKAFGVELEEEVRVI